MKKIPDFEDDTLLIKYIQIELMKKKQLVDNCVQFLEEIDLKLSETYNKYGYRQICSTDLKSDSVRKLREDLFDFESSIQKNYNKCMEDSDELVRASLKMQ